ncbi:MAG TPA: hypothetical protein VHH90_08425 [Polyangia bacterium]|nr:hypothetical protein [Polyangia bacterium]
MSPSHTRRNVCTKNLTLVAGLIGAAGLACGSSGSNQLGSGGAGSRAASGGNFASGGTPASGGATASGGSRASGGTTGTGAAHASGGAMGTGGVRGSGGVTATGSTTGTGGGTGQVGSIGGCQIFPADNPWNQDVSALPLNPMGSTYLAAMHPTTALHADWGDYAAQGDYYGIPFTSGTGAALQPVTFADAPDESDPNPCPNNGGMFCYPIPLTAPIEGGPQAGSGEDRHVLYIDTAGAPNNCTLYELYSAQNPKGSGWSASSGAIFHLGSNALRPDGWTSADAAGLPVLAGLVRFDETVNKKEITHAIRFTVSSSQQGYIHPATHAAGSGNTSLPPMGLRMRLKASVDTSKFTGPSLVIVTAMKKYGIILADNGSNWYITGESNDAWVPYMDQISSDIASLHGSDFEAVDTGPVSTAGL